MKFLLKAYFLATVHKNFQNYSINIHAKQIIICILSTYFYKLINACIMAEWCIYNTPIFDIDFQNIM